MALSSPGDLPVGGASLARPPRAGGVYCAPKQHICHRGQQTSSSDESREAADGEDQGHDRAVAPELVQSLCDLLGTKLVAYLSCVTETRTVHEWADPAAGRTPPRKVLDRLRLARRVATLLGSKDSAAVIQAWFQGRNPLLDDVAPARLLRDSTLDIAGPSVMAAARAFAASPENSEMRDPRHA